MVRSTAGRFCVKVHSSAASRASSVILVRTKIHPDAAQTGKFQEIVDQLAGLAGRLSDDAQTATDFVVQVRAMVFFDDAHIGVDGAQRRPQIVRDRIRETLQFLVGFRQAGFLVIEFIVRRRQCPVAVSEGILRALLLRDVVEYDDHTGDLVSRPNGGGAIDHMEKAAILPEEHVFLIHQRDAGQEDLQYGAVFGGKGPAIRMLVMDEVVHFASDQLVFRPAEQSLSRAIHGDNETLPIHRIESFTDVAEDRLLVLQGLTEPFTALRQQRSCC